MNNKDFSGDLNNLKLGVVSKIVSGEIVILKEFGKDDIKLKFNTHPVFALFLLTTAISQTICAAATVKDELKLDLSGNNLEEMIQGISKSIINEVRETLKSSVETHIDGGTP